MDNIQLLTHKANTWKSSFTHEELRDLSERSQKDYLTDPNKYVYNDLYRIFKMENKIVKT